MKEDKTIVAYVHNPIDILIAFQEATIKNLRSEVPPHMIVMMQDILSILKGLKENFAQIHVEDGIKN